MYFVKCRDISVRTKYYENDFNGKQKTHQRFSAKMITTVLVSVRTSLLPLIQPFRNQHKNDCSMYCGVVNQNS